MMVIGSVGVQEVSESVSAMVAMFVGVGETANLIIPNYMQPNY